MTGMDCRTCQPALLDLAYGELAPELAAATQAHVAGCGSCKAALENLQGGIELSRELPTLEPPAQLHAQLLAYAEEHARKRAIDEAAAHAKASVRAPATFLRRILDAIGRMAAGRQFAMATIMVLIVLVGVWSLPDLQRLPSGQGVTVVSPDPAGEAAPSGGLRPADPLELAVDERGRRIRSRDAIAAAPYRAPASAEAAHESEAVAGPAEEIAKLSGGATPASKGRAEELDLDDIDSLLEVASAAEPERRAASAPSGVTASQQASTAKQKSTHEADVAPLALGGIARPESTSAGSARSAPGAASGLAEGAPVSPPSEAKMASNQAPAAPSPAVSTSSAGSADGGSLARARTTRSEQGCGSAIPLYQRAIKELERDAPASLTLGLALIELAECQTALGQRVGAQATLARAQRISAVAARAKRMLAQDAAARGASTKPAAADSAGEPVPAATERK